ncbi:DUF4249 domain-containing protein [Cesiribacter sp. SM1]|uniref:DUF4249 domain-containing protein n=1 Tax=Cesiribacter sp. SM1 TaxID=2861196 RepID=UPI001CD72429|nr:DUF4249 domain-containing protein [Cesiribacter sp. SM1]
MKYWLKILLLSICTACLWISCVDPYEPPVIAEANNFLVIEGVLRSGEPTTIKLTRTARLADTARITPERSADVRIECESCGLDLPLQETADGVYVLPPLDLNPNDRYRLHIKTSQNREYLSDYVEVKQAPPIDSLNWTLSSEGVQLYVTTHDPQNNTRYYRWEFEETWEFRSLYQSTVDYVDGQIIDRVPPTPIRCWQNNNSTSLLLGSSAKLGNDIIYQQPLTVVPHASWKLSTKYSILVKQFALSKEAFEYYQQMKKNSEQMGSFFDPQPVELGGNIYSLDNANEPVIGFFSAGQVQEKRIYIRADEVQPWGYRLWCDLIEVTPDSFNYYFGQSGVEPIYQDLSGVVFGLDNPECYDCSTKARPVQPDFWE